MALKNVVMAQLPVPTEAQESRVLMQYMRLRGFKFTHVKNETGRSQAGARGKNFRAMWDAVDGVSPGFPDFVVVCPDRVICIELKRSKGGTVSPHQVEWLESLNAAGMLAFVARGADEAIAYFEKQYPQRISKVPKTSDVF